jgi:hypothetical protein
MSTNSLDLKPGWKMVKKELSRRLTAEFGKGFDIRKLRNMRQFYLMFSKRYALRTESLSSSRHSRKSGNPVISRLLDSSGGRER